MQKKLYFVQTKYTHNHMVSKLYRIAFIWCYKKRILFERGYGNFLGQFKMGSKFKGGNL